MKLLSALTANYQLTTDPLTWTRCADNYVEALANFEAANADALTLGQVSQAHRSKPDHSRLSAQYKLMSIKADYLVS